MLPEAIDSDTVAASAHIARAKSVICGCELAAIKTIFATNASFDPESETVLGSDHAQPKKIRP
jgi:hypothetical protein